MTGVGPASAGSGAPPYSAEATSLMAKRLHRVQVRRVPRRVQATEHAQHRREEDRTDGESGRDEEQRRAGELHRGVDHAGEHPTEHEARQPAGHADDRRLGDELKHDGAIERAEGLPYADLARTLADR